MHKSVQVTLSSTLKIDPPSRQKTPHGQVTDYYKEDDIIKRGEPSLTGNTDQKMSNLGIPENVNISSCHFPS